MDLEELLQRAAILKQNRPQARSGATWYRVTARQGEAEVYLYDEIGAFGITAQAFVQELAQLDADSIRLHLNSPGGDVFDGIAIYNALKAHRAQVNVQVDSLAASIASVVAMAGDRVEIAGNAQVMIHDARGLAIGTADDMRELAELLDASSDIIAAIYQARAGGQTRSWRKAMKAITWYRGKEAVDAGLADAVFTPAPQRAGFVQQLDEQLPATPATIDYASLFREAMEAQEVLT